ncbi:hypothetical protein P280DRAFT_83530 [Massarina eburnea CBS 473.64]|uniref:Uncharacterized protein n=1 Tax=Massarina eburnea CBS 473.64 TaxID=1395130 RepID=A0A6A6RVY3_9PLEO|nr:hypothetical protein P280DRAFT_83530 [Massarina eburnea CBS 473.64]
MSEWLQRLRNGGHEALDERRNRSTPQPIKKVPKDPNKPQKRLQLHQKCLYERMMPGRAFISAHVNRLQHGYYDNGAELLHERPMNNVSFVSVHFVFHPYDPRAHRFKSAEIKVSIHGDFNPVTDDHGGRHRPPASSSRILKHAPELMYGAVSPENLQWNFSLSSSLGVSQVPLAATVSPSGGVRSSYRIYDMMSIQGSLRSLKSPLGPEYDVDDAQAVWTLEENLLQRSGLPREFDFVLLVHKPDHVKNVHLTVEVDAVVGTWFGEYPQWYTNLPKYMPTQDATIDFRTDIGQRFLPSRPGRGFNFADLPHPLDDYVQMPGTIYPTNDSDDSKSRENSGRTFDHCPERQETGDQVCPDAKAGEASPAVLGNPFSPAFSTRRQTVPHQAPAQHRQSWAPDTLNVRVLLEHSSPRPSSARRYSASPDSYQEPAHTHSIRRKRSRPELKAFGAQQTLHVARETLKENNLATRSDYMNEASNRKSVNLG